MPIIPPSKQVEVRSVHTLKRFALVVAFCLSTAGVVAILNVGSVVATSESFVRISNTATQPVPVRDVETPWQTQLALPASANTSGTTTATFTVPTGRQLSIGFVSSPVQGGGPALEGGSITTTVAGVTVTHTLNVDYGLSSNLSQLVRIYADPGSTVLVTATYGGTPQPSTIPISLSGVLEPAP
jgi:hypothetical protein